MKVISWNVNGIAAKVKNNSMAAIRELSPDIVCIQEIRTRTEMTVLDGYYHFFNPSNKGGYSGTLVLTKEKPLDVTYGMGELFSDDEGRIVTVELDNLFIVNTYAPKSDKELKRHQYRLDWDRAYIDYLIDLSYDKPVIACGDFNVARLDIDIYPENMRMYFDRKGYVSEEISDIDTLLDSGFADAFRELYPHTEGAYTWWSNRLNKREQDRGWRLDYFFVSEEIVDDIVDVIHHAEIMGSDHCPIELELNDE